jgi:hypothetical protein
MLIEFMADEETCVKVAIIKVFEYVADEFGKEEIWHFKVVVRCALFTKELKRESKEIFGRNFPLDVRRITKHFVRTTGPNQNL